MAFYNEAKNPLPFYKLEGDVWTNLKPLWFSNECKGNCCHDHFYAQSLHDFQLLLSKDIAYLSDIEAIEVRSVADNSVINDVAISHTIYLDDQDNKFLTIKVELNDLALNDRYYISVSTTIQNYYSEKFCVVQLGTDVITLEWASSNSKVGSMVYPEGFKHRLNIEAVVVPQEPSIEEETVEDGYGQEKPTLQILTQGFLFSFLAPNYMAQALSALELHDLYSITNRKLGENNIEFDPTIKKVSVKATPEADGCFSFCEVTFIRETIIKTACNDSIRALNNPPEVAIYWEDTMTTETRTCTIQNGCEQIMSIDMLFDPDGNLDTYEWESSTDGTTWATAGAGDTLIVNESVQAVYQYRLKAVDTFGAIGYSNILTIDLKDATVSSYFSEIRQVESDCVDQGKAFEMDVVGSNPEPVIRIINKFNFSHGFTLKIFNSLGFELISLDESFNTANVDLPLTDGTGTFYAQLCLKPCLNTNIRKVIVELELYENDGLTLSGNKFNIFVSGNC